MKRILCLFLMVPFMTLASSLQDGLVAWYKFDGNANDSSGNGNNGTAHGVTLTTDRNGNSDSAYSFDGDDWISVAHDDSLNPDALTVSVWMKPSDWFNGHIPIICKSNESWREGSYRSQIDNHGDTVTFMLRAAASADNCIEFGKWQLITLTLDNQSMCVYRNGVLIGCDDAPGSIQKKSDDIGIGRNIVGATEYFKGSMDDFRIYNRALSAAEVKALYEDGGGASEVTTYTITFDANGGTPTPSAMTREEGEAYGTLPVVTKNGFWFDGWYTSASGGTKVTAEAKATGNVTLYAHWASFSVTAVTAQQRYPWNGLVDITVTIQGAATDVADADCLFAATNSATKAALPVTHVTQNGADTGSGTTWTRKYIWDTNADVGEVKIDDVALAVEVRIVAVQLWENGPYWATCNVGATKPEEYGYYFWWGDTVGYKRNSANNGWVSVKDGSSFSFSSENCPTYHKDNSQLRSMGYIDSTGNLVSAHDAATAHLGASWRMPTDAEFSAMINNCDTEWTTINGVSGRLVKGRGAYASRSIFLPAAGYGRGSGLSDLGSDGSYWSSPPSSGYSPFACYLGFDSGYFGRSSNGRYFGQSVRPVRGFAK